MRIKKKLQSVEMKKLNKEEKKEKYDVLIWISCNAGEESICLGIIIFFFCEIKKYTQLTLYVCTHEELLVII